MSSKPPVEVRLNYMGRLVDRVNQLAMSIDLVDDELRDHIRADMIYTIMYLYSVKWVDAVSRFNDIVKGFDSVDPDWPERES